MTHTVERIDGEPALAIERCGMGDPIVFLHGIGGNRTNWAEQLRHFGSEGMALAFDFRGYGDSADPGEDLVFADFVDDVLRVVDHYHLGKIDLVGLSMGGLVAQAFYARHPERVRSMVLVACRPGSAPVAPGEAGAAFVEDRMRPLLAGGPAALADSLAVKLIGSKAPTAAQAQIRASLLALRPDAYLRTLKARVAAEPFLDLGAVAIPVLVIAGEDDKVAPPAQMKALAAAIPASRLAIVSGAGHLLNIEQPERFNDLVSNFLNDLRDRSARFPATAEGST